MLSLSELGDLRKKKRDEREMGDIDGEEPGHWNEKASEEKILVSVRVRPLNAKDHSRYDVSEWECVNDNTIMYKNSIGLPERSQFPSAYAFDRVFGESCSTKQVYEEGAKEIALSVVNGINSSIFAYGQTSSGKTYTMNGITEYAVSDIYDYIENHKDREFTLKFSAMEIYNEALRDLLSTDSTPLRLLDDPERGTIVDKLTEETLRDKDHLQELISICEAQRQIGETALNETSSRSHQILRLTIESSACRFLGAESSSSLTASVSFIDLAGSERASQTLSEGTRLKEGCHINRSLLTLGTVIRKLSKGRSGHIPYRDSKLTRILQTSLGGNARTAIICTMSPSRRHLEQSRNTLFFASCAKEVSTDAHVNVVMSDKKLVKQLQKELARLESELKSLVTNYAANDFTAVLKEKELLIEKMDKEIKDLTEQRDLAHSQIEDLLKSNGEHQSEQLIESGQSSEHQRGNTGSDEHSELKLSDMPNTHCPDLDSTTCSSSQYSHHDSGLNSRKHIENEFLFGDASPKLSTSPIAELEPRQGSENTIQGLDENSKDICNIHDDNSKDICSSHDNDSKDSCDGQPVEIEQASNRNAEDDTSLPFPDEKDEKLALTVAGDTDAISTPSKEGSKGSCHTDKEDTYATLEQKLQAMRKTIERLFSMYPKEPSLSFNEAGMPKSKTLRLNKSRSCKSVIMSTPSPWFDETEQDGSILPIGLLQKVDEMEDGDGMQNFCGESSQSSVRSVCADETNSVRSGSVDETAQDVKTFDEWDSDTAHNFVAESNEMAEVQSAIELGDNAAMEMAAEAETAGVGRDSKRRSSKPSWAVEFRRQQKEIIALWDACYVPLAHRTCFFLLFKGKKSDFVYMEVELKRLYYLRESFARGIRSGKDNQPLTLAGSIKALNREREMLVKQIQKRFSKREIENIYEKWGIDVYSKQRRLQLVRRVWSDSKDMNHIKESAGLVAKLIGFAAPASQPPQQIFGLSFAHNPRRSASWKSSSMSTVSGF